MRKNLIILNQLIWIGQVSFFFTKKGNIKALSRLNI